MDQTAGVVTVRTTSSGAETAYRVVTGLGVTPELTLTALRDKAGQVAREWLASRITDQDDDAGAPGERLALSSTPNEGTLTLFWRFDVVDVHFTPGPVEGQGSGWLAYGTLTQPSKPERRFVPPVAGLTVRRWPRSRKWSR